MSLKQNLGALARAVGQLPVIRPILYHPSVRGTVQTWPGFNSIYGGGWYLLHPYDRALGTDTSGFVATADLPSSPFDATRKHVYAGSQPSIIRTALTALPPLAGFAFIDLGCGKGRPLLVASEFCFRELIGVELSPSLAGEARKNAAILKSRFPSRIPLRVETGDASTFAYPNGNLVVFLYNPFGEEVMAKVVAGIETTLTAEKRNLFVVYYNPVHGKCFDASRVLSRYYASTIAYSDSERGFGPDTEDPVVIWQAGHEFAAHPGADAEIVVTNPGARAELR